MATTPGLTWAVKDSLMSYVEALDDGTVEAFAPASRSEAGFFFPWHEHAVAGDAGGTLGSFAFGGAVRLAGHWGMLDVELREPRVTLSGGSGSLLVRERGSRDPGRWLSFADLVVQDVEQDDTGAATALAAAAALSGHGRLLLGGQYDTGTALSPLRITLPPRHG